jgi:hypothetical protein
MPPARKREPVVPQKVRDAVEYMFTTPGATLQSAAKHVGLPTFKLRFAMSQPHCLRWMLQEKQARLGSGVGRQYWRPAGGARPP